MKRILYDSEGCGVGSAQVERIVYVFIDHIYSTTAFTQYNFTSNFKQSSRLQKKKKKGVSRHQFCATRHEVHVSYILTNEISFTWVKTQNI